MNKLVSLVKNWLETSTPKQKLTVALLILGVLSTLGLVVMTSSSGVNSDPLASTPVYVVGVFVKLGIVLLLIVGTSMIFRRYLQPGMSGKKTRQVQLLETVRLSPKQAVHLISVGGQQLLVGATDQNISLITHVEADVAAPEAETLPAPSGTDFASVLQGLNLRSPDASTK